MYIQPTFFANERTRETEARLALMRAYVSARRAVLLAAFIAGMLFDWGIRGFFA